MLPILLLDLLFTGAAVYLFLQGEVLAGVVMLLMGAVAFGALVVRYVSGRKQEGARGLAAPTLGAANRVTPEVITLEPALEHEVRDLARRNRLEAVKRVKELTGASLKAAKEYVDRLA